jgi:hypothetical protein
MNSGNISETSQAGFSERIALTKVEQAVHKESRVIVIPQAE